jgi:hypothetical protein
MFVPSAEALMNALNASKDDINRDGAIEIPTRLLRFLLQIALSSTDFDENEYLRLNPDVAEAIRRGDVKNGKIHYIGFGYFEGRRGAGPVVDDSWYLQRYPDVDSAVRKRKVASANDHFHAVGGGEGRSPNADYEEDALQWKQVLRGA